MDPFTGVILLVIFAQIGTRTVGSAVTDMLAAKRGETPPSLEKWRKSQENRKKPGKEPGAWRRRWRMAAKERAVKADQKHQARMEHLRDNGRSNVDRHKEKLRQREERHQRLLAALSGMAAGTKNAVGNALRDRGADPASEPAASEDADPEPGDDGPDADVLPFRARDLPCLWKTPTGGPCDMPGAVEGLPYCDAHQVLARETQCLWGRGTTAIPDCTSPRPQHQPYCAAHTEEFLAKLRVPQPEPNPDGPAEPRDAPDAEPAAGPVADDGRVVTCAWGEDHPDDECDNLLRPGARLCDPHAGKWAAERGLCGAYVTGKGHCDIGRFGQALSCELHLTHCAWGLATNESQICFASPIRDSKYCEKHTGNNLVLLRDDIDPYTEGNTEMSTPSHSGEITNLPAAIAYCRSGVTYCDQISGKFEEAAAQATATVNDMRNQVSTLETAQSTLAGAGFDAPITGRFSSVSEKFNMLMATAQQLETLIASTTDQIAAARQELDAAATKFQSQLAISEQVQTHGRGNVAKKTDFYANA